MDANQIEDWLAESELPERAELDLIIIPLIPELTPEPTRAPSYIIPPLSPRIFKNICGISRVSIHWKTNEY
jgi:hypothetical protein